MDYLPNVVLNFCGLFSKCKQQLFLKLLFWLENEDSRIHTPIWRKAHLRLYKTELKQEKKPTLERAKAKEKENRLSNKEGTDRMDNRNQIQNPITISLGRGERLMKEQVIHFSA